MGRGLIISGGIEGQYQVQLQYDRSRAEAQIASLATELDVIPARLEDLQAEINSTTLDLDYATEVQRAKITAYQADPSDANSTALNEGTTALRAETNKLQAFKQSQRLLRLRQTSTQKQIDFLNAALPPDIEVAAWCADYNEQLSGAVGLIESGLVEGPQYTIRPAGENGDLAAYNAASDGQITPLLSMSAAAAFLNYARLPGQAKWRPRYRLGTITSLDPGAANCNLNLDSANSTHQQLGINQSVSLSAVPISYMMCNAAAFTVGDRVVVEFIAQDWSQPQVIGFVDHPRPCALPPYMFIPTAPTTAGDFTKWCNMPFFDGMRDNQWVSGLYYDAAGEESDAVFGAQKGSGPEDAFFACHPGIVWDMENHCRVPIINPETDTEITQTVRSDPAHPEYTTIYAGVYPHVAAECLGINWATSTRGGNVTIDPKITGDSVFGLNEGVLSIDYHRTVKDYEGLIWRVQEETFTPADVGAWVDWGGVSRFQIKQLSFDEQYPDSSDLYHDGLAVWEMGVRRIEAEFYAATRGGVTLSDVTTPYEQQFTQAGGLTYIYTFSGVFNRVTSTEYRIDGVPQFVITNKHDQSFGFWATSAECDYSGFSAHPVTNTVSIEDEDYAYVAQAYGTLIVNRHRNRIALWKDILYEGEAGTGHYGQIEYSNNCPLKGPGLLRNKNASYDHTVPRSVMDAPTGITPNILLAY